MSTSGNVRLYLAPDAHPEKGTVDERRCLRAASTCGCRRSRTQHPGWAEEIELGRYFKTLFSKRPCTAVHIEPHRTTPGNSPHIFDVFVIGETRP